MIDIKSLFLAAKNSGAENDVKAYIEAVINVINASPRDYVLQLEYIIQSSAGINTLIPFIEKWGMPIALYDTIYECVSECIDKAEAVNADTTAYTEAKKYLEEFRLRNIHGFVMYEFYRPDDVTDYIKTYYGFTKEHQNRFLAAGMIKKFGEYAIPDAYVSALYSERLSGINDACFILEKYLEGIERTPLLNQFICNLHRSGTPLESIMYESAFMIVNKMHADHQEVFREAMIMGDEDAHYTYTQEQVDALQDLISYYEYMLTWTDETHKDPIELQKMIYDLYEEASNIEEDHSEEKKEMKEKKDSDFVPLFAVLQSYQHDETDNYGNKKDASQKALADINKVIRFMTKGDKFSHALISLDDNLEEVYSFGSLGFEKAPIEHDKFWVTTDEIYISVMFVTKEEFESVKKFIQKMKAEEKSTTYAYSNLVKMFVGRPVINNKRNVCSTFTACVLQHANPKLLHRDYSRIRPEDITIIPRSFYVMTFKDRDDFLAKKAQFKARVKAIKEEHIDEIKDYNNDLPKIMLKEQMDKLGFFDKIIDWFASKGAAKMNYKKRVD